MKKVILATAFLFALSIGVSVPVAAEEVAVTVNEGTATFDSTKKADYLITLTASEATDVTP